jgi:gamma-glutamyltranspeptidase/glutathione hydrolase
MDDFTVKPGSANLFGLVQGAANAIAPGKRPLSSMAPTIVLRDGKVRMIVGSPGGARIISTVLQVILNTIDFDMAPQEAVDAPRIHLQWLPDVLYAEPLALSPDTRQMLVRMGYRIEEQTPWGAAETIAVALSQNNASAAPSTNDSVAVHRSVAGAFYGVNDSRRPAGAALAP